MRKWGGKREGAGSGGKREGAGRPRTKWNAGTTGKVWLVEFAMPNGMPSKPQQWRFISIDENCTLEFQNIDTEEIISIIHPNKFM